MKYAFFLAIFLSSITGFGSSVSARDLNGAVSFSDFRTHPEEFEGRLVEINARVVAISADSKSMELFDSESKSIIQVRMGQLSESNRKNLIKSDVRYVSVIGRATVTNGRVVIDAQRVVVITGSEVVPTTVLY